MTPTTLPSDPGAASGTDEKASQAPVAGALQAAAAVVAWREAVDTALTPVFGTRGVAALVQRSVHLAAVKHPFLGLAETASPDTSFAALHALLIRQSEAEIAATGATLVSALSTLLDGLVGGPLTQRLLPSVQASTTSGPPAQDDDPP